MQLRINFMAALGLVRAGLVIPPTAAGPALNQPDGLAPDADASEGGGP